MGGAAGVGPLDSAGFGHTACSECRAGSAVSSPDAGDERHRPGRPGRGDGDSRLRLDVLGLGDDDDQWGASPHNRLSSGSVLLWDDEPSTAMFRVSDAAAGASGSACIAVRSPPPCPAGQRSTCTARPPPASNRWAPT